MPDWTIDRVQRSRKKGAKLPPDTLCVCRPSRWGNPWIVKREVCPKTGLLRWYVGTADEHAAGSWWRERFRNPDTPVDYAVAVFRRTIRSPSQADLRDAFRAEVRQRGIKHLACWCPLDEPCHADVWIQVWETEG